MPDAQPAQERPQESDESLIRRLKAGENNALSGLVARYEAPLLSYLRRHWRFPWDRYADIVQIVWAKFLGAKEGFESGKAVWPFIFTIAYHEAETLRVEKSPIFLPPETVTGMAEFSSPRTGPTKGIEAMDEIRALYRKLSLVLKTSALALANGSEQRHFAVVVLQGRFILWNQLVECGITEDAARTTAAVLDLVPWDMAWEEMRLPMKDFPVIRAVWAEFVSQNQQSLREADVQLLGDVFAALCGAEHLTTYRWPKWLSRARQMPFGRVLAMEPHGNLFLPPGHPGEGV